jgi:hypothetical protein
MSQPAADDWRQYRSDQRRNVPTNSVDCMASSHRRIGSSQHRADTKTRNSKRALACKSDHVNFVIGPLISLGRQRGDEEDFLAP